MRKLSSFLLEAKKQTPRRDATGHLIHVSDRLFHGNANETLESLRAMFSYLQNLRPKGHKVGVKADGGMSAIVGKKNGKHFVAYKGLKEIFHSMSDIVKTGKEHYVKNLGPLLKRVKSMKNLPDNVAHQLDILFTNRDSNKIRPNTITYDTPENGKIGVAPHKQFRIVGDEFHAEDGSPDLSHFENPEVFAADLDLKNKKFKKMKKSHSENISRDMGLLEELLSDKEFVNFSNGLKDNKKFHAMLQAYSNHEARGGHEDDHEGRKQNPHGHLSIERFRKFIPEYIEKRTVGIKTKHQEHIDHHKLLNDNEHHFETMFAAHNAATSAMHGMLDHFRDNHHVTNLTPSGDEEHEGLVHTSDRGVMSKFVRRGAFGFAFKNRARTAELRAQSKPTAPTPPQETQ